LATMLISIENFAVGSVIPRAPIREIMPSPRRIRTAESASLC
jgi:hypothetical protein